MFGMYPNVAQMKKHSTNNNLQLQSIMWGVGVGGKKSLGFLILEQGGISSHNSSIK